MTTPNRFNLIDEPWIPIVNVGRVSLKQLFTNNNYLALSGNPIQKVALMKLLLAIAQAAYTPIDEDDWLKLGSEGLAKKCIEYLNKWYDRFWLYGAKPFLQMPEIANLIQKRPKSLGQGFYPNLPAENDTILTQYQSVRILDDAEKTSFIVTLMNFSLGGKQIEKDLDSLTPNYEGKSNIAKAGPSLGNFDGYLHSFVLSKKLHDTLWINLFTHEHIRTKPIWEATLGTPPWEKMPEGEDCVAARNLKKSYMGCLVAMSRFVLLQGNGIYYVEGIQYHQEVWQEPSMGINHKTDKILKVDVNKKPWRNLTSFLSFVYATSNKQYDYKCMQVEIGLEHSKIARIDDFYIWSGGLKVSKEYGGQFAKGNDDFVESQVMLNRKMFDSDTNWFEKLECEMSGLDKLSKIVYHSTLGFFKCQKNQKKVEEYQAEMTQHLFWQFCEHTFHSLVNACDEGNEKELRNVFANYAKRAYDVFCLKGTARQLEAWAKNRPEFNDYHRVNGERYKHMNKDFKEGKSDSFVNYIIDGIQKDKGFAAKLRRADNSSTEYQSWEVLANFVDLEKPCQRLPFATIAAAIAKAKITKNGSANLGQALASCYPDGNKNDQAKAKLRRLLASDSIGEVCRILRTFFNLIISKSILNLDYGNILDELLNFQEDNQQVKVGWAQNFYGRSVEEEE